MRVIVESTGPAGKILAFVSWQVRGNDKEEWIDFVGADSSSPVGVGVWEVHSPDLSNFAHKRGVVAPTPAADRVLLRRQIDD